MQARASSRWRSLGFTLIELLVVLAIIASLLAIVAPRYFGQIDRAAQTVLRENLYGLRHAIELYDSDKGQYPATLQVLVDQHYLRNIPVDPITGKASWQLIREGDADDKGIVDVRSTAPGAAADGTPFSSW